MFAIKLIVITGISGAGKTYASKVLEDIGFYCVDNMPPKLLPKFAEISFQTKDNVSHIAIVTDARSKEMFNNLFESFNELINKKIQYKMLFLDADNDTIIKRYKETRRKHPLMSDGITIEEALTTERKMLARAKDEADYVIDTSHITTKQLRERIIDLFLDDDSDSFMINCMSFGYKYGIPVDSDLVFDVRCLPNPYYIQELKEHTGLERCVSDYVISFDKTKGLLDRLYDLIDYLIPLYRDDEGKTHLNISIGCTGGKHRSVTVAEQLKQHLKEKNIKTVSNHRDIKKVKN